MSTKNETTYTKDLQVMDHPAGLFVLFFSEMWERFSYYGMRALLVLFLVSEAATGGWEWTSAEALTLYGTYTMWVYITPILGGMIADKWMGYRWAIILGALLMTLGHAAMAIETEAFFYLGLLLLVVGNGFFKPNISSMVGQLYGPKDAAKKDGGYTIFYMGINAGAFLGILLCGYIGEKIGWSYGFGLAGVFMFFGMLMFYFGKNIFDNIGLKPKKVSAHLSDTLRVVEETEEESAVSLEMFDSEELDQKIELDIPEADPSIKEKLRKYVKEKFARKVRTERLVVIVFLAIFSVIFWMCFEQAGGSMNLFAKDFTQRTLQGGGAVAFKWIDAILTIVPMLIISYVLLRLFKATFKKFALSNIVLACSFLIIWGLCIWKVQREFNMNTYQVQYTHVVSEEFTDTIPANVAVADDAAKTSCFGSDFITDKYATKEADNFIKITGITTSVLPGSKDSLLSVGTYERYKLDTNTTSSTNLLADNFKFHGIISDGKMKLIEPDKVKDFNAPIETSVIRQMEDETEVTASWFQILNSLFIILFAPVFAKFWEKRWNPSAPVKFALGMIFLGLGFGFLALGAQGIVSGQPFDKVSMIWLVFAFLFHTWGELCISPVGLSFVSKLSPKKLVGLMFGIWFFASAMGNKLAGTTGAMMEGLSEQMSLSKFFLIYVGLPGLVALIIFLMRKWLTRMMHGIK